MQKRIEKAQHHADQLRENIERKIDDVIRRLEGARERIGQGVSPHFDSRASDCADLEAMSRQLNERLVMLEVLKDIDSE